MMFTTASRAVAGSIPAGACRGPSIPRYQGSRSVLGDHRRCREPDAVVKSASDVLPFGEYSVALKIVNEAKLDRHLALLVFSQVCN